MNRWLAISVIMVCVIGVSQPGKAADRFALVVGNQFGQGETENRFLSMTHLQTRLGGGLGYRLDLVPVGWTLGLTTGVIWLHESIQRRLDDGAEMTLKITNEQYYNTLGPYIALTLSIELSLTKSLNVGLHTDLQIAWLRVDETQLIRLTPSQEIGVCVLF